MTIPERKLSILVVDDDEKIRRALKSILSARKYEVVLAENGEQAIDLAIDHPPDMMILDLSLPGISGINVCRELRSWYSGPVLILSVHGAEKDKVSALDCGADDYLTKPFSAAELLARIRAQIRRTSQNVTAAPVISVDDLDISIAGRTVTHAGKEIDLTRTEFDILAYLAQNPGCVLTYKMILEKVWGPDYIEDYRTLRVHVSHLRKKIEPDPNIPKYIMTEPGIGFRFISD